MLYIGIFLGYCFVGFILKEIVLFSHITKADRLGYNSWDYWADDNNVDMLRYITNDFILNWYNHPNFEKVLWTIYWPVLLYWMNEELFPTLYLLYDKKQPEYEPEEELN